MFAQLSESFTSGKCHFDAKWRTPPQLLRLFPYLGAMNGAVGRVNQSTRGCTETGVRVERLFHSSQFGMLSFLRANAVIKT